jgi:hypothetical protein
MAHEWPITAYLQTLKDPCLLVTRNNAGDFALSFANKAALDQDVTNGTQLQSLFRAIGHTNLPEGQSKTIRACSREVEISGMTADPSSSSSSRPTMLVCRFGKVHVPLKNLFIRDDRQEHHAAPMIKQLLSYPFEDTVLGHSSTWSLTLRTSVFFTLSMPWPCCLCWGKDHIMIYNDLYAPILGKKHPYALGRPARETWPEVWDALDPIAAQVMESGEAVYNTDTVLFLETSSQVKLVETIVDWSYVPISDELGQIQGWWLHRQAGFNS